MWTASYSDETKPFFVSKVLYESNLSSVFKTTLPEIFCVAVMLNIQKSPLFMHSWNENKEFLKTTICGWNKM